MIILYGHKHYGVYLRKHKIVTCSCLRECSGVTRRLTHCWCKDKDDVNSEVEQRQLESHQCHWWVGHQMDWHRKQPGAWRVSGLLYFIAVFCCQGRLSLRGHRDLIWSIKTVFNNVDFVFHSGRHCQHLLQSTNLRNMEGSQAVERVVVEKEQVVISRVGAKLSLTIQQDWVPGLQGAPYKP